MHGEETHPYRARKSGCTDGDPAGHLAGDVHDLEPLEEVTPVRLQGGGTASPELPADEPAELVG
jgi:hypothetical protein